MYSQEKTKKYLECLNSGEIELEGQFMWGSNYTYLCNVTHGENRFQAVYKPTQGERPLWDFPSETLAGREVAAFLVSEAGGWHMVPPTVYRQEGPAGPGSLQLFIEHESHKHYFNMTSEQIQRLRPVAMFDAIINNTDRKGGHILLDPDKNIWLIDHGICFHAQPKLRTVVWDFAGESISEETRQQIGKLKKELGMGGGLREQLSDYLAPREIQAIAGRIEDLLESGMYPRPADRRYSYPWPPV